MIKKYKNIMKMNGADYLLAVQKLSEKDAAEFYGAMNANDRDHNNRIMLTPHPGPPFPLQLEKEDEIVLMNWQPNDQGIGGQLFYRKDTGKWGTRAMANGQKVEVSFDEDYGTPAKNENGGFSYSLAASLKAEELAAGLGGQVAKLAGIELPKFEPDVWEDEDGKDYDWTSLQTTEDDQGVELDICYSALRHQFRVALTGLDQTTLCKKFNATYVPIFGMDVSDQTTAYNYAEALANIFDERTAAPQP